MCYSCQGGGREGKQKFTKIYIGVWGVGWKRRNRVKFMGERTIQQFDSGGDKDWELFR